MLKLGAGSLCSLLFMYVIALSEFTCSLNVIYIGCVNYHFDDTILYMNLFQLNVVNCFQNWLLTTWN